MKITRFSPILLPLLGASLLSGCATTTRDPYTDQERTSRATQGAVIGGVVGAIGGAVTGDNSRERTRRALVGAAAGGLVGGGIGYYMDQQEEMLRQRLRNSGVSVTRIGDQIILNMPGNITFATDSQDINRNFYPVLNSVGLVLAEFNKSSVEISGHTDSTGSSDYNQRLSEQRAQSVASYLISGGVQASRLFVLGRGESAPIASNDTPQGRQTNRRVEIRILPPQQG